MGLLLILLFLLAPVVFALVFGVLLMYQATRPKSERRDWDNRHTVGFAIFGFLYLAFMIVTLAIGLSDIWAQAVLFALVFSPLANLAGATYTWVWATKKRRFIRQADPCAPRFWPTGVAILITVFAVAGTALPIAIPALNGGFY